MKKDFANDNIFGRSGGLLHWLFLPVYGFMLVMILVSYFWHFKKCILLGHNYVAFDHCKDICKDCAKIRMLDIYRY